MKIAHIVGNRPQFVKLALLYHELQRRTADRSLIIHTGQHFNADMSAIFFEQLRIPLPDHPLQIHSLSHNEMIGNMLIRIDTVLATERPDCVIVYGDTNTTLAGALAAKKRNISLVHIESGIRTGKEDMPEESNRYLTDRMADWNFACTWLGLENLVREGYGGWGSGIYNCGDLMLDAALLFKDQARQQSRVLTDWDMEGRSFILATIHRAENTDNIEALQNIVQALNILHADTPVLFPVHPKTMKILNEYGMRTDFIKTGPLGYLDMLALTQACRSVITDSGGLSREAFFFHKPTLVIMQNPFWPEIFIHGNCLQARAFTPEILEKQENLLSATKPFKRDVFGDGKAAVKISELLIREVSKHG